MERGRGDDLGSDERMRTAGVFAIVAIVAGLLLTAGCGETAGERRRLLRVGMELGYPPFEMTDERGRPSGVSVELAAALAKALGAELEIQNLAFDGLIPALKTGKIDLILSSMTRTEERSRSIDFSDPYLKTGLALLARRDAGIAGIEDCARPGRTVAVKKGTTGHLHAEANLAGAELLVLDKESACVLEVIQGKADAFIYDQMSVYQHWKRNPETTVALLRPIQEEVWAIGVRKGNDSLRGEVNQFLAAFKESGGFELLGEKFLSEPKRAFKERGIPFLF